MWKFTVEMEFGLNIGAAVMLNGPGSEVSQKDG